MISILDEICDLSEQTGYPLKTAYNNTRGFYAQLSIIGKNTTIMEELPSDFMKVTKSKNNISFTTNRLVSVQNAAMIKKMYL